MIDPHGWETIRINHRDSRNFIEHGHKAWKVLLILMIMKALVIS